MAEVISHEEFTARMRAQDQPREHCAVVCVACGTVQSLSLFKSFGVKDEEAERCAGFSCVGRHNNAGQPPRKKSDDGNGCNWSLGGLFRIHELEVTFADGHTSPAFQPATKEQAAALRARVEAMAPA